VDVVIERSRNRNWSFEIKK